MDFWHFAISGHVQIVRSQFPITAFSQRRVVFPRDILWIRCLVKLGLMFYHHSCENCNPSVHTKTFFVDQLNISKLQRVFLSTLKTVEVIKWTLVKFKFSALQPMVCVSTWHLGREFKRFRKRINSSIASIAKGPPLKPEYELNFCTTFGNYFRLLNEECVKL